MLRKELPFTWTYRVELQLTVVGRDRVLRVTEGSSEGWPPVSLLRNSSAKLSFNVFCCFSFWISVLGFIQLLSDFNNYILNMNITKERSCLLGFSLLSAFASKS